MKDQCFPARLHVILPTNSDNALVIRRGPSKQTCILSWNTQSDEVQPTQWLKGRIYERRSDVSPDGKHWIYFAMNGRWNSKNRGSWTAIAKVPWLKAIGLFLKGDCWHGGGLFLDNGSYWLNDGYGHETQIATSALKRAEPAKAFQYFGGECATVYYNRLMRDGWTCVGELKNGRHDTRMIFEKPFPRGWILRKICHAQIGSPKGKGCYWDEHATIPKSGTETSFPDWEWADIVNGHLVYAEEGSLFRIRIENAHELSTPSLIHDFNGYNFEPVEAPY